MGELHARVRCVIPNALDACASGIIPRELWAQVCGIVSRGVKQAEIAEDGHLIFTMTDNSVVDLGLVKGDPGEAGKSAYEAAVEGGYTGTEAEFNEDLAKVSDAQPKELSTEISGLEATTVEGALEELSEREYAASDISYHSSDILMPDHNAQDAIDRVASYIFNLARNVQPKALSEQIPGLDATTVEGALEELSGRESAQSWDEIEDKPFERLGDTLKVEDGTLDVNIYETGNPQGGNTLYIGG